MKNFLTFLMGAVVSLVVIGVAGAWYFLHPGAETKAPPAAPVVLGDTAAKPATPGVTQEGAVPDARVSTAERPVGVAANTPMSDLVFLEGEVALPPPLQKILERKTDAVLSVTASINSEKRSQNALVNSMNLAVKTFPAPLHFQLDPAWVKTFAPDGPFHLTISAAVCFDRKGKPCDRRAPAKMSGRILLKVSIPPSATGARKIAVGSVVLNRYQTGPEPAQCNRAGRTIQGTIVPTERFLASAGQGRKFALVGMPLYNERPPFPYSVFYETPRPLTAEELKAAPQHGIVTAMLNLDAAFKGRFSVPVPQEYQNEYYRFQLTACHPNETDADCTSRSFPMLFFRSTSALPAGTYPLVAKGFELPVCGKQLEFYLHDFDRSAPLATSATVYLANPSEAVEGMVL
jgi:hypothetical protein